MPRREDGSLWELGRGNMGVTYRAYDTSLQTDVALKVIRTDRVADENVRRRFRREARAAAKIRHPNIASVLYLGEQGGEFFYTMEFVPGRSLEALLKEANGPLPVIQAIALAAQAAAALNAAHKREVVHRDLKPANLMLLEGDSLEHEDERTEAAGRRLLKIIDFGLARSFGTSRHEDSLVTQTVTGFVGTPAYASPEQGNEEHDLDGRSDLYSLGIILWQMLTGRLPFTGRVMEVLGRHQVQPPPLEHLAALPAPVAELLSGLLIKNPAERQPQTASDLRTALDKLLRTLISGNDAIPSGLSRTKTEDFAGSGDTTNLPNSGSTLLTRYLLDREVGIGDGGRLFHAADLRASNQPVAVKLLAPGRVLSEPSLAEEVSATLERLREHPDPVFLTHDASGLQRSEDAIFYVREWAQGLSFDELLRVRPGGLPAVDVLALLESIPPALDRASSSGLAWVSLAPHKLFIVPAEYPASKQEMLALCKQAVGQWPLHTIRLNPVDFPRAKNPVLGLAPSSMEDSGPPASFTVAPVAAFARLTRSLLGASADGHGSSKILPDDANAVLARAMDPAGFGDCSAFWSAWRIAVLPPTKKIFPANNLPLKKVVTVALPPRLEPLQAVQAKRSVFVPYPQAKWYIALAAFVGIAALCLSLVKGIRKPQRESIPTATASTSPQSVVRDASLPESASTLPTAGPTASPAASISSFAVVPNRAATADASASPGTEVETGKFVTPEPTIAATPPPTRKATPRNPNTRTWTHPQGLLAVDLPEHFTVLHPTINPGNVLMLAAAEPATDVEFDVLQVNNTTDPSIAWRYIQNECNKIDVRIRIESTKPREDGLIFYEGTTFNFGNYRWIGVSKVIPNGVIIVTISAPTTSWQSRYQNTLTLLNNNVRFR